jgi:hypothetical protein
MLLRTIGADAMVWPKSVGVVNLRTIVPRRRGTFAVPEVPDGDASWQARVRFDCEWG